MLSLDIRQDNDTRGVWPFISRGFYASAGFLVRTDIPSEELFLPGQRLYLKRTTNLLAFLFSCYNRDYLCHTYDDRTMVIWGTFFAQVLGYFLGCVPYIVMDVLRLPFFERYKVQQNKYADKKSSLHATFSVLLIFIAVVLPLIAIGEKVLRLCGMTRDGPLPSVSTIFIQVVFFFFVEDYTNYWIHRWLHTPFWYKHVHSVHHEFTAPFSLAATYAHPIEIIALGIPTFLGPLLIGPHLLTLWIWMLARNYEAIDIHSGYELPWNINNYLPFYAGTQHHDFHHYMHSGNFASIFVWCDRLYGTDVQYETYRQKVESS